MISKNLDVALGEESLYDVVAYGIWCLEGVACNRVESAYAFLEELHTEHPDVGGEPGWRIERIELVEGFEKARPYLKGKPLDDLLELQHRGEEEGYWVWNKDAAPEMATYSSKTFWRAVRESLLAFGRENPTRKAEVEEAFRRYRQLRECPPGGPA